MGTSGGFSDIFDVLLARLRLTAFRAQRRNMRCLNGDLQDHAYNWAENRSFSAIIQRAENHETKGQSSPAKKTDRKSLLEPLKPLLAQLKPLSAHIGRGRVKQAALATGVIGSVMFSVFSVHASLQDPNTIKIIQDPKFYMGIESGYGRMALNSNGLNLATPGLPKTGMFGDQNLSGSFLFGAANLIQFSKGASLRGELEYQKLGKPNVIKNECCTTTPLSAFSSRDIETNSGFANLWLDFDLPIKNTKVFLGGGVGLSHHSVSSMNSSFFNNGQSTQFAYHFGGGVSHSLSPAVDFVVAGRYRDLGSSKLSLHNNSGGNRSMQHTGFEARIGLRYKLEALMPRR